MSVGEFRMADLEIVLSRYAAPGKLEMEVEHFIPDKRGELKLSLPDSTRRRGPLYYVAMRRERESTRFK